MIQSRICNYLDGHCKHTSRVPTTFLDLPERIRHRIYFYQAALAADTVLYIQQKNNTFVFSPDDCDSAKVLSSYANLRLASRVLKGDIARCLCTHYRIEVHSPELSEFTMEALVGPPYNLLRYCKRLTVVLNSTLEWGSGCGYLCCTRWHRAPTMPIANWDARKAQKFLPSWTKMIKQLALSQHYSDLELSLICDVADSKTADLILDPIRQLHIPKCTIRLNADNIVELEDVARKAVLNVTGHMPAVREHFRFLELPTEIRQHILGFTDLVTPYQEVQFWALPDCGRYDLYDTRRREHSDCRQAFYRSYCDDFCSKHHSVYPAVCGCFLSPLPFLLVCRKLLQDSRQVFYSRNRFVLRSESSSSYPREQPAGPRTERFEASVFLHTALYSDSLRNLRSLEILFQAFTYTYHGIEPAVLADWEKAIQRAACHCDKLALTLYMGHETHPWDDCIRTENLAESKKALIGVYEQIVRPLEQLRGILDVFFVHTADPFLSTRESGLAADGLLQKHEAHLEALVMGDSYDSVARGKYRRPLSRWASQKHVLAD